MQEVVPLDIATNEMSRGAQFISVCYDPNLSWVRESLLLQRAYQERR